MDARSVWNMRAALTLLVSASLSYTAVAQTATTSTPAKDKDEPVKLEKFEVTGSLIPVAAGSAAIPITTISSIDIEKTGVNTDLLQVIKKTQPNFYGSVNIGSDNGNISSGSTNGGSQVALRNRATLVLINGRRAAVSPVVASGGFNFVDVSMIPIAAVEKIEILADGASATYGSDAVSGVVNIIMKTNYSGVEVGGFYGWSPNDSNWSSKSYNLVAGASSGKTNITISTEWKKSDPLIQNERDYGKGQFRTPSFAGSINIGNDFYYLNPSLNAPPVGSTKLTAAQLVANGTYIGPLTQGAVALYFDLAAKPTMLIEAARRSFTAAVDSQISENIKFFGDFIYSINETRSILNAQPVSGNVVTTSANSPFSVTVTARNRFVDYPRIYEQESTSTRGVTGFKGDLFGSWKYEIAGNFNRTLSHFRNYNLIDAVTYTNLVNAGTYNPFARNQAAGVVASMLGTSFRDYQSELLGADFRVSGEVIDLPGGPLALGIGAETRKETLKFVNDRYDQTGQWLQATPRLPFSSEQKIEGMFAEVRVPIFDKGNSIPGFHVLEASVAVRAEKYSKVKEDPTVPKYSLRWLPFNDELALRASYSESFNAPTLYDLFGPLSQGFTASININRYDTSGASLSTTTGSRQYRSQSGSNANLNPSQSRNWTAGVVWSPKAIKGLEVSVDWFNLDERDLISTISSSLIVSSVEQYGPASPYASLVRLGQSVSGELHFADGAPITTPGQMSNRPSDEVWINNASTNVAGFWQDGADISVDYTYDTNSWGKLHAGLTAVYLRQYAVKSLPTSASVDYQDGFTGTGVYPRYRTYTSLDWQYKNMFAQITHTFIPSIDDLAWSPEYRIDSYSTFDVQFSYNFADSGNKWLENLRLTVGVNNVFNKMPPLALSEGNQSHDISTYDPIGRFIYFGAKYKF